MSKGSAKYEKGVYAYENRNDGTVLVADARSKRETDPVTGVVRVVPANNYGTELHKILSANPQDWSPVGGWDSQPSRRTSAPESEAASESASE